MTINTSTNNDFHQGSCPIRERNQSDPNYQNCANRDIRLEYRCSKCVIRCLKCEAPRLNTNAPYVRGCNEARLAVKRAFSCVCIRDCEV